MVVSTQGEIIISHRRPAAFYTLALKSYDFDLDDWVAFDMDGLNAGANMPITWRMTRAD